jgi:hypothetical protein
MPRSVGFRSFCDIIEDNRHVHLHLVLRGELKRPREGRMYSRSICLRSVLFALLLATNTACLDDGRGRVYQSPDISIDLSNGVLSSFDPDLIKAVLRYCASHPNWDVREERGQIFAVRLEKAIDVCQNELNGFHSYGESSSLRETRVLLSFGRAYGYGDEYGNVTRAKAGTKSVDVTMEQRSDIRTSYTSYVIVEGTGLYLEICESSYEANRRFTQDSYNEVCKELESVSKNRRVVAETGLVPVGLPGHYSAQNKPSFSVHSTDEPGTYCLDAAVNPTSSGFVYAKVFDQKTGKQLLRSDVAPESKRYVGWHDGGERYFPYTSRITILEGSTTEPYTVRVELWHCGPQFEKKLAERTHSVRAWER